MQYKNKILLSKPNIFIILHLRPLRPHILYSNPYTPISIIFRLSSHTTQPDSFDAHSLLQTIENELILKAVTTLLASKESKLVMH